MKIEIELDPAQAARDLMDCWPAVRAALMARIAGDALPTELRVMALRFLTAKESGSNTVPSLRAIPPTTDELTELDRATAAARLELTNTRRRAP